MSTARVVVVELTPEEARALLACLKFCITVDSRNFDGLNTIYQKIKDQMPPTHRRKGHAV